MKQEAGSSQHIWKQRLQKLGVAGFLFFLIKGLLWLIVPYAIATGLFAC